MEISPPPPPFDIKDSWKSKITKAQDRFRLDDKTEKHVETSTITYFAITTILYISPLQTSERLAKFQRYNL